MKHSPAFINIASDAKTRVKETDITAVKNKLERQDHFYLVDVREGNEYVAGHLPNAIHLSKGVIERDIEKTIGDTNANIILYCGGGFRSALAADNIQKMGYKNVLSMNGGFTAWNEAGHLVVTE